jgi:hypothetical protein
MKRLTSLGVLLGASAIIVATAPTGVVGQPPPVDENLPVRGREIYYTALIGTRSPDFETGVKNPLILEGKPAGGTLTLWLNGDPVGFYTNGLVLLPLGPFLHAGMNELTFSGFHIEPVYVTVSRGQVANDAFVVPIAKQKFPARGTENADRPLLFEVGPPPETPDREWLAQSPLEQEFMRNEARTVVDQLQLLIRQHKGDEAIRLLNEGLLLRAIADGDRDTYRPALERAARAIFDPETRVIEADRQVRAIYGRRTILLYGENPANPGVDGYHLFSIQRGTRTLPIGPLQLARVYGHWLIWYAN